MSSFRTHMVIGMVGGLAMLHSGGLDVLWKGVGVGALSPPTRMLAEVSVVVLSAVVATWPDIDEPESWLSQRVRGVLTGAGTVLGGLAAFLLARADPPTTLLAVLAVLGLPLVGAVVGALLGRGLIAVVRHGAGGHRRLTHSLVLTLPMLALAWLLMSLNAPILALVLVLLVWGQWLHLLGDVVTPAGVPLFWPLSAKPWWLLPRMLRPWGERIALGGATALALGLLVF